MSIFWSEDEFQIRFEAWPDHLRAFVSGPRDSMEVSRGYWSRIAAECVRSGIFRVLVEEDFPNSMSEVELYELVTQAEDTLRQLRIAFVDRRAEQSESNRFAETVARNRGLAVRVFEDLENATLWLRD